MANAVIARSMPVSMICISESSVWEVSTSCRYSDINRDHYNIIIAIYSNIVIDVIAQYINSKFPKLKDTHKLS